MYPRRRSCKFSQAGTWNLPAEDECDSMDNTIRDKTPSAAHNPPGDAGAQSLVRMTAELPLAMPFVLSMQAAC